VDEAVASMIHTKLAFELVAHSSCCRCSASHASYSGKFCSRLILYKGHPVRLPSQFTALWTILAIHISGPGRHTFVVQSGVYGYDSLNRGILFCVSNGKATRKKEYYEHSNTQVILRRATKGHGYYRWKRNSVRNRA
jgi:hypothetical protein